MWDGKGGDGAPRKPQDETKNNHGGATHGDFTIGHHAACRLRHREQFIELPQSALCIAVLPKDSPLGKTQEVREDSAQR
jgi:hypothetical protein